MTSVRSRHRRVGRLKPRIRPITSFALIVLLPLLSGCGGMYLMPTPNLYADGLKDLFYQVPAEL
jgi:hypothetical protein